MHDSWLNPRSGGRDCYGRHFKELFIRKQINIKFIQCVILVYLFRKTSLSLGDELSFYGWITMMISIYFQMVQKKKKKYVCVWREIKNIAKWWNVINLGKRCRDLQCTTRKFSVGWSCFQMTWWEKERRQMAYVYDQYFRATFQMG